jgi:hypothetical protein
MAKGQKQAASKELALSGYPNSIGAAFPQFNDEGIFNAGMTKAEFATVHFVAAHLHAHGKYPMKDQLMSLGELSLQIFDRLIPALVVSQINPALAKDLMDGAEFPLDETPE